MISPKDTGPAIARPQTSVADSDAMFADPLVQSAIDSLLRAGATPVGAATDLVAWQLEASRGAVLLWARDSRPESMAPRIAEVFKQYPLHNVDIVVVGGGEEVRRACKKTIPMFQNQRLGMAHLGADGALWIHWLSKAHRRALESRVVDGSAPLDLDELRRRMAEASQLTAATDAVLSDFAQRVNAIKPTATYVLTTALVAVFVLEAFFSRSWSGSVSIPVLIRMGACVGDRVRGGELWRLLSHGLLHASWMHVAFNAYSLVALGSFYERLLGRGRFLAVFVLAVIGGGIASTLLSASSTVMIGASGGVFGLLGLAAALAIRPGSTLPKEMLPAFRKNITINLVIQGANSLSPQVSLAAHFGGAAMGFFLMISGLLRPDEEIAQRRRAFWIPALALAGLMSAALVFAIGRGRPWALNDSAPWHRYPLTTAFSAELPNEPHGAPASANGTRELMVASFTDDGYFAALIVNPYERLDDDALRSTAAEVQSLPTGLGHPANTTVSGPPRTSMLGGFPLVEQDFRGSDHVRFRNTLSLRHTGSISAQVIWRDDMPSIGEGAGRRIIQSVQGD